jgi:hypothetical protein
VIMIRLLTSILSFILIAASFAVQGRPSRSTPERKEADATVNVVAFDPRLGKLLGPPIIRAFRSEENNRDFARSFQPNAADGIPFDTYRIEAYLPGYFSAIRDVGVYQRSVTIVVGLGFGYELPDIAHTLSLRGRVIGLKAAPTNGSFVKLTGIYSAKSTESTINSSGEFEMSGLFTGKYLLLVVTERGVIASQVLTIPDDGPTVDIKVGSHYQNANLE